MTDQTTVLHLFYSPTRGKANNDGLTSETPVLTIQQALDQIPKVISVPLTCSLHNTDPELEPKAIFEPKKNEPKAWWPKKKRGNVYKVKRKGM
jgi:hypothetical protein